MTADRRMKLTVLGGYLGSGKTTWLRHHLHHGTLGDAYVIVNEAAEMPVDDVLLGRASRLSVIAGGCVCCTTRDELLALLRGLADARVGGDDARRVDRIVLETSGLADPGPIVEAIRADPVLVHHVLVAEIVVAVDAVYGLTQLRQEPLGRRQAELADRLVVTKIDEANEADLGRLLAALRALNPLAEMSGAVRGSPTALPDVSTAQAEALPDPVDAVDRGPIFPTKLVIDPTVDWTAFSVWLSALLHARGDDVLRVKGVVRTPAGRLLLQSVRRTVQSPEILPEGEVARDDDSIVVIGRGYKGSDLARSLRHFAGAAKG